MTHPSAFPLAPGAWRQLLPWLLLLLVGALAGWLRYGLIEPISMLQTCAGPGQPAWCHARRWLVIGFLHDVYGTAALLATAASLLSQRRWLAWLAAALGAFALQLYDYEAGALALLVGSLRLLRLQASPRTQPISPTSTGRPG